MPVRGSSGVLETGKGNEGLCSMAREPEVGRVEEMLIGTGRSLLPSKRNQLLFMPASFRRALCFPRMRNCRR